MVIPAGVAHRNMGQSPGLLVVGTYPGGADWDLLPGDPDEHTAALRATAAVFGRERPYDPSFGHSRPRFGCCGSTFSPSIRQMRSTRLWFVCQPSARN